MRRYKMTDETLKELDEYKLRLVTLKIDDELIRMVLSGEDQSLTNYQTFLKNLHQAKIPFHAQTIDSFGDIPKRTEKELATVNSILTMFYPWDDEEDSFYEQF